MSKGKIAIIVGGTPFWIDAFVFGLSLPPVPPNQKLRAKLEKKTCEELLEILKKLDPRRAETIEQKNPRRLIRAIEIAKALGRVPPLAKKSPYDALWIGLNPNPETLKKRIGRRAAAMMQNGLLAETKKLLKRGIPKKRIRELGFEYRLALAALEKKISRRESRDALARETLRYARRQMRWWKRNPEIQWIQNLSRAEELTTRFL